MSTLAILVLFISSSFSSAQPLVTALNKSNPQIQTAVMQALAKEINLEGYREVRVKILADHAVIYMSSKTLHRLDLASVDLNRDGRVTAVHINYHSKAPDQPVLATPQCPDPNVEFIAFAPNDDDLEQQVTQDVATAAENAGLKTVRLLKATATAQNYVNYMVCPKLKGNFYDGDANPEEIVTVDGTLAAQNMQNLAGALRLKVTNIWLACEAFNDPMLSSMIDGAKAQKYAAGINDLIIGPSDNAGACAMKAAIAGQPMTAAFQACYKQYDDPSDHWGFSGNGSDLFGN